MLPSLNLLLGEASTTDLTAVNAALDPESTPGAFANELDSRVFATGEAVLSGGEGLPRTGNDLPLLPTTDLTVAAVTVSPDAIAVTVKPDPGVLPKPEITPVSAEILPVELAADPEAIVASLERELAALSDEAGMGEAGRGAAATPLPGPVIDLQRSRLQGFREPIESVPQPVEPLKSALREAGGQLLPQDPAVPEDPAAQQARVVLRDQVVQQDKQIAQDLRLDQQSADSALAGPVAGNAAAVTTTSATPLLNALRESQAERLLTPARGTALKADFSNSVSPAAAEVTKPAADDTMRTALAPIKTETGLPPLVERPMGEIVQSPTTQAPPATTIAQAAPDLLASSPVHAQARSEPATTVTTPSPAPTTTITLPVQAPDWDARFADRIVMMANGQQQHAEIRLTPAELGPLRVRLSVEGGEANVAFVAQHAVTREAIEQALPRLRELLAENGLSLGHTSVGDDGVAEGKRDGEQQQSSSFAASGSDEELQDERLPAERLPRRVADSLVDTFV